VGFTFLEHYIAKLYSYFQTKEYTSNSTIFQDIDSKITFALAKKIILFFGIPNRAVEQKVFGELPVLT